MYLKCSVLFKITHRKIKIVTNRKFVLLVWSAWNWSRKSTLMLAWRVMTWICVAPTLILGRAFSKGYTTNFPKMPIPPFFFTRARGAKNFVILSQWKTCGPPNFLRVATLASTLVILGFLKSSLQSWTNYLSSSSPSSYSFPHLPTQSCVLLTTLV